MPSRQYTGIDLQNYVAEYVSGPSSSPVGIFDPVVSETSQAILTLTSNEIINWTNPPYSFGISSTYSFIYEVSGDFDFNIFPSIPDNALINRVTFRINASILISISAVVGGTGPIGGGPSIAFAIAGGVIEVESTTSGIMPSITLQGEDVVQNSDENNGPLTSNAFVSIADSFTNFQEFDFAGSPLTKDQLTAAFGSITIRMRAHADGDNDNNIVAQTGGGLRSGSISQDNVYALNNFQMLVEYSSGPEFGITLDPSGGNVEPGRIIRASGDVHMGMGFASTSGTKVIPIIQQEGGGLETPSPASEDCLDCLGGCPACDSCLDACAQDLNSEACQECLQACLDCLEECFENLELAEGCQQSTQQPRRKYSNCYHRFRPKWFVYWIGSPRGFYSSPGS